MSIPRSGAAAAAVGGAAFEAKHETAVRAAAAAAAARFAALRRKNAALRFSSHLISPARPPACPAVRQRPNCKNKRIS